MKEERIAELLKYLRLEVLEDDEDTSKDKILTLKLKQANSIGLQLLYPFKKSSERPIEMPEIYNEWLVMAGVELFRKIGDENIKSYAENGLSYTYGTASTISNELATMIVPQAGIPRKAELEGEEENESQF